MRRISESLMGVMAFGVPITVPPKSLEALLVLQSTETYKQRIEALTQAEAGGLVGPSMPRDTSLHPGWYRAQLAKQRNFLDWAKQRDAIQLGRPAGCWCLGLGHQRKPHGFSSEVVFSPSTALETLHDYCSCPDGKAAYNDHYRRRQQFTSELQTARLDRIWGSVGIPPDHEHSSFERYLELAQPEHQSQAAALVQGLEEWQRGADWMVMFGEAGRGKSALACCLIRESAKRGQSALYVYVPAMLDRLRASHDPAGQHRTSDVLDALYSIELLALDDLGAEKITGYVQEAIRKLVTVRLDNRRRTIVTTNLDPTRSEFSARVGDAVASRILGRSALFLVGGPDLRLAQRMAG